MSLKETLKKAHEKVEHRPSDKDSNFNYVHQEDVFDLIKLAYKDQSQLAEDIISELMADEEMKLRKAYEVRKFFSVITLNKCRKFFDMEEIESMNPKNFTEAIQ